MLALKKINKISPWWVQSPNMCSLGPCTFSFPSFSSALIWTAIPTDEDVRPVAVCLEINLCILLKEWGPKQLSDQGGASTVQVLLCWAKWPRSRSWQCAVCWQWMMTGLWCWLGTFNQYAFHSRASFHLQSSALLLINPPTHFTWTPEWLAICIRQLYQWGGWGRTWRLSFPLLSWEMWKPAWNVDERRRDCPILSARASSWSCSFPPCDFICFD